MVILTKNSDRASPRAVRGADERNARGESGPAVGNLATLTARGRRRRAIRSRSNDGGHRKTTVANDAIRRPSGT